MSYNPTPKQALLLFGVLARQGACAQAELARKIETADREVLIQQKFLSKAKDVNRILLKLEDLGWAWAAANISAELPKEHRTLADILNRLKEHLADNNETLADFIGSKPQQNPAPSKTRRKARKKQQAKTKVKTKLKAKPKPQPSKRIGKRKTKEIKSGSLAPDALRRRIESAYLTITNGRKNEIVRLTDLRAQLFDVDRATLDSGLRRILRKDKKAFLMRHDDPNQLGQADHDAAFNPAGEPFHVIWISQ